MIAGRGIVLSGPGLIIGRGRGSGRGPSLPDDVLAWLQLDPVVYVHPYAELAGRPVRYQDAAAETPVTEFGQPTGAVVQPSLTLPPADWENVGTQPTDANRFRWADDGLSDPLMPSNHLSSLRVPCSISAPFTCVAQSLNISATGYMFDARVGGNTLIWGNFSGVMGLFDGAIRPGDFAFTSGPDLVIDAFWVDSDGSFRFYRSSEGWGDVRTGPIATTAITQLQVGNHQTFSGGNGWRGPIRHFAVLDRIEEDLDGLGAL